MKYGVLMRYPEYAADNWPDDMYVVSVRSRNARAAADKGRTQAFELINKGRPTDEWIINRPDDLAVICVFDSEGDVFMGL